MYHLIRSIYLHATSKEEYSILLLGLDNAGKTTLLNQVKSLYNIDTSSSASSIPHSTGDGAPSTTAGDTVPTVGQNVATISLPDMYIKIWDVGGQMTLRRLWTSYYKSCHGVIFVVDSSDLGMLDDDNDQDESDITATTMRGDREKDHDGGSITPGSGLRSPTEFVTSPTGGTGRWAGGRGRRSSYAFPIITNNNKSNNTNTDPNEKHDSHMNETEEEEWQNIDDDDEDGDITSSHTNKLPSSQQHHRLPPRRKKSIPSTPITPSMLHNHSHTGRLDECRSVLESVLSHPDMSGIPILVLANKQDREDCLEVVRIKEGFVRKVFEGDKGGMVRDSRVLPVSALKGTGVKEAVEWVRTRVVWNKGGRAPVMR